MVHTSKCSCRIVLSSAAAAAALHGLKRECCPQACNIIYANHRGCCCFASCCCSVTTTTSSSTNSPECIYTHCSTILLLRSMHNTTVCRRCQCVYIGCNQDIVHVRGSGGGSRFFSAQKLIYLIRFTKVRQLQ